MKKAAEILVQYEIFVPAQEYLTLEILKKGNKIKGRCYLTSKNEDFTEDKTTGDASRQRIAQTVIPKSAIFSH